MSNIMNFDESKMKQTFAKKYTHKTFFKRYVWHYNLLLVPEILVLLLSAILSLKYWEHFPVIADYCGTYALPVAVGFSMSVSLAIWLLSAHQLSLVFGQKHPDIFIIPLLALVSFNFYTDWNGVPQLAEEIHQKPVFESDKENQLNAQIQGIYEAYRWCGKHNSKHNCPHAFMPSSPGQIKDVYARYGFNPSADRETVSTLQTQINRINADYQDEKKLVNKRQNRFTQTGRGGTIICLAIFFFCSIWRTWFEYKSQLNNEAKEEPPHKDDDEKLRKKEPAQTLSREQIIELIKNNNTSLNMLSNTDTATVSGEQVPEQVHDKVAVKCKADGCEEYFMVDPNIQQPNPRKYCSKECKDKMCVIHTKQNREREKWQVTKEDPEKRSIRWDKVSN